MNTDSIAVSIQRWKTLALEHKKADFLSLIKSKSAEELDSFMVQLETNYDEGHIYLPDFSILIRVASCISFAVHVLRTRQEIPLLHSAADVVRVHWGKSAGTLENLLFQCDGASGLVKIIASLPVSVAVRIIRVLAARGAKDRDTDAAAESRTRTIDSIIIAAIPIPGKEHELVPAISRLAPAILTRLTPAASESLLRTLLPLFERSMAPKTWKCLARRHPLLISQLVIMQISPDADATSDIWAKRGLLDSPEELSPAVFSLGRSKLAGKDFPWKCLVSYASHVQQKDIKHKDIFGRRSGVLSALTHNRFTAAALEASTEDEKMQHVLNVLETLSVIHTVEGRQEWSWQEVSPVMDCIIDLFPRHPEEWMSRISTETAVLPSEDTVAVKVLRLLFKNYDGHSLVLPQSPFLSFLQKLPEELRFPIWSIAFSIRFSANLNTTSITPYYFSPFLLRILGRTGGEGILRRGIQLHGVTFLSKHHASCPSHRDFDMLRDLFPTLQGLNAAIAADAVSAVFHCAWLCSHVRRWEDVESPLFQNGMDTVKRHLSNFKSLATRARTGAERLALLQAAFAIILPTHDLNLLNDTLEWAANRFSRDPEAGIGMWNWLAWKEYGHNNESLAFLAVLSHPLVNRTNKAERLDSYMENLRKYFVDAGKVLRTLRKFLDLLAAEPGRDAGDLWDEYGATLEKIIQSRTDFLSGFSDTLLKRADLRDIVYEDLSSLILSHGKLGRVTPHPAPAYIGTSDLLVPRRLWKTVIPWIDDLAARVEELYRAAFNSELGEVELLSRDETFWPIRAILTTDSQKPVEYLGDTDFDISSTCYYRHMESLLFGAESLLLSTADYSFEDYHGDQRLRQYVEDYLTFSQGSEEAAEKVKRLLVHYGSRITTDSDKVGFSKDYSSVILGLSRVREAIKRSSWLCSSLLDLLLPQYPQSGNPTEMVRHNPLDHMPAVPTDDKTSLLATCTEKQTDADRYYIFQTLLEELTSTHAAISPHHMQRLAFLTMANLCTLHDIPAPQTAEGQGPISEAIRYMRLTDMKVFNSQDDGGPYAARLLGRTLAYIPTSEVKKLVSVITALPLTNQTRPSIMALNNVLRKCPQPDLGVDLSFYILRDADSSSWHRHTLVQSFFCDLRPEEAHSIMSRFLHFLHSSKRPAVPTTSGDGDGKDRQPAFKITTLKMFLELVSKGIQSGFLLGDAYNLAYQILEISNHPSVVEAVIGVFIQTLCVKGIGDSFEANDSTQGDELWTHLRSFVQRGARIAENVEVTNVVWDAARRKEVPMPIVDDSHIIAHALCNARLEMLSPNIRVFWVEEIITPLLKDLVANRTRWLKVALAREGGSDDEISHIYGSFDTSLDLTSILRQITDNSPQGLTQKCRNALFPLLEQRLQISTSRGPLTSLFNLTQGSINVDDRDSVYPKDVRALTVHAMGNEEFIFSQILLTIIHGIRLVDMPEDVVSDLVGILERLSECLLAPENMLVSHDPQKKSAPFSSFLGILPSFSPSHGSKDYQWHKRIRPILEYFLNQAEKLEREQSKLIQNGGAPYWPVIICLKVLLLPHPAIPPYNSVASDRAETYGQALMNLGKEILRFPAHHRLLVEYLFNRVTSSPYCAITDVVPICKSLASIPPEDSERQELRLLCFDIAVDMLRAFYNEFEENVEERTSRDDMIAKWSRDSDGMVKWMAHHSVVPSAKQVRGIRL